MPILATVFPVYTPAMRIIAHITNAEKAVVTTTFPHGYIDGIILRLIIPLGYGMVEANQKFGAIIVTSPTTFTITIDTRLLSPFTIPETYYQYPQTVPFGEINSTLKAATKNVLPY